MDIFFLILMACIFSILLSTQAPFWVTLFILLVLILVFSIGQRSLVQFDRQLWMVLLLCFSAMALQVMIRQELTHHAFRQLHSFEKLDKTYTVQVICATRTGYFARILSAETKAVFPTLRASAFCPGSRVFPGDTLLLTGSLSGIYNEQLRLSPRIQKRIKASSITWIFDFRATLLRVFRSHLPRLHADVMAALILGTQGVNLQPSMVNLFRDLGLLHLLVVSGAQVALITQMVLTLLRRLFLPQGIIWVTVLLFNGVFMIMTGAEVSIVRAVLMVQISTFLTLQHRHRQMLDVLWLTAILLLVFNPAYLYKLGFILSFLATFALIDLSPRLENLLARISWLPNSLRSLLALSLAPLLLTMPVIAYVYHRWDLLSLISNILIGPIIEILVLAGFIALLLGLCIPILAHVLFIFLQGLLVIILLVCDRLYAVPFHTIHLEKVFFVNILLYYTIFCLGIYRWAEREKYLPYLALTMLVVMGINLTLLL